MVAAQSGKRVDTRMSRGPENVKYRPATWSVVRGKAVEVEEIGEEENMGENERVLGEPPPKLTIKIKKNAISSPA